jgi:hypothetical protein
MPGDIEVQDAPPVVADDEEAIEHVESESRDGEEIHGSYRLAVIAQKSQPALGRLWDSRCSPHPAGNGCFRHREAEHEEFAVDARRTPSWILRDHPEDQFTDLFGNSPTATNPLSYLAEHGPIRFESGPVPPSNRFRQDQNEHLLPSRPEAARQQPKQLIEWPQLGSGMLAFQDGKLLAQGEVLQHEAPASAKNAKYSSEPEPIQVEHGGKV